MLNKVILKTKFNEDHLVPTWFFEWFIIMEKLKNDTFYQIEEILSKGDFFWAQIFFKEKTSYNREKVWH